MTNKLEVNKNISKILQFFDARVQKYGAPYVTFAIFGLINYPLAYFIRVFIQNLPETESLALRGLATLLCFCLYLKNRWPNKLQKFLPLYWFCTVTMSLPVIVVYLLLKNKFSLDWLINASVGLLITLLVLDWAMSLLSILIGTIIGYAAFMLHYGHIALHANPHNIALSGYLYAMIILFCAIFLRNKETFYIANKEILETMVKQKSDELNESVIRKDHLVTNVVHEVRGPAHVVSALSGELLSSWERYDEKTKLELITQIANNGKSLLDLSTNWIEAVSLANNKKVEFDMRKHNLLDVVALAVKDLQVIALEKKIRIICPKQKMHSEEYNAHFHSDRITQVLKNLCSNAIKFSPKGSEVTVDICQYGWIKGDDEAVSGLCVSVEDSGAGIPEDKLESIFESFTQGHDAKNKAETSGVGLGLSIARFIINGHGGKIWVENNKSKAGSKFSFFIPYNRINSVQIGEVETKFEAQPGDKKRSLNVLFLDDDETNCLIGSMLLKKLGHGTETFMKSDVFLRYLKDHYANVDLIFVDLIMPVSGHDIVKELRDNKLYDNIPIIIQTGVIGDPELTTLLSLKNVSSISKPYGAVEIAESIDKMLQAALETAQST